METKIIESTRIRPFTRSSRRAVVMAERNRIKRNLYPRERMNVAYVDRSCDKKSQFLSEEEIKQRRRERLISARILDNSGELDQRYFSTKAKRFKIVKW